MSDRDAEGGQNFYIEYDGGGPLHCPGCGRVLGSFASTHTIIKDQCGATLEVCASHKHPDDEE